MPTNLYFLLFGTLLLVQCVLSNSSEKTGGDDNSKESSSEEKNTKHNLTQHVSKLYINMVDETAATAKKVFEPVIKVVETNEYATNTNVQDKLTELKTILAEADTKNTITEEDKKRYKNHVRKEMRKILRDLEKIEDENRTPTELDLNVRRIVEAAIEEFKKNVQIFVERTIQDIEDYWRGLSTTEQNERQQLHDVLTEVKNEQKLRKKLELLENLCGISNDTITHSVTW